MSESNDIYVIVTERDTRDVRPDSRPIVFEQYTDGDTLNGARAMRDRLGDTYGKVRIAKLVFVDE